MKSKHRIIALIMAIAIIMTIFSGIFLSLGVSASTLSGGDDAIVITTSTGGPVTRVRSGTSYTVTVVFEDEVNFANTNTTVKQTGINRSYLNLTGALSSRGDNNEIHLDVSNGNAYMVAIFRDVYYNSNYSSNFTMNVNLPDSLNNFPGAYETKLGLTIPDEYTGGSGSSGGGSSSGSDGDTTYSSHIQVENVILRDKDGNQINGTVTKDSPAFTMEIVYTDLGLEELDRDDIKEGTVTAYLENSGGFVPGSTNRGTVGLLASSGDYPRFRITFTEITYEGGSNQIGFYVHYTVDDQSFGQSQNATVHQAKADEDEDDEIAPPTPYIIISQYSYGSDQIEAGQDFSLDITYRNTSTDMLLENIVMTVTPDPDNLSIASASNTFYIDNLEAGGARSASILLQAKPAASVGSHEVNIEFTYEYIAQKERKQGEKTEKIAVPITQIDRFAVDVPTEMSDVVTVGDEGYVTLKFANQGKSTTYNISAKATGNLELIAPSVYHGSLEANKSDEIDVTFIPQESGDLYGEIIVQYEDENANQKEVSVSFQIYVQEPYVPPEDPGMEGGDPGYDEGETTSSALTIWLCAIGGLLMAVPIALYLIKRVRAKGSEEFDEDF